MTLRPSVVLKLSGEALGKRRPLDGSAIEDIGRQVAAIAAAGLRVGVVVGGGNIIRGSESWGCNGLPRREIDTLGMRATALNAYALQAQLGVLTDARTVVVAKPGPAAGGITRWTRAIARDHGVDIIIAAGGLGRSGISTDVAAPTLAHDMRSSLS